MSGAYEPQLPLGVYPDAATGVSSGHSGSSSSADRAHAEDAAGTTTERQQRVLRMLATEPDTGFTWQELAQALGLHHGQASSALSHLHRAGAVARLTVRRNRCAVYVLPGNTKGRDTELPGRQKGPVRPVYAPALREEWRVVLLDKDGALVEQRVGPAPTNEAEAQFIARRYGAHGGKAQRRYVSEWEDVT